MIIRVKNLNFLRLFRAQAILHRNMRVQQHQQQQQQHQLQQQQLHQQQQPGRVGMDFKNPWRCHPTSDRDPRTQPRPWCRRSGQRSSCPPLWIRTSLLFYPYFLGLSCSTTWALSVRSSSSSSSGSKSRRIGDPTTTSRHPQPHGSDPLLLAPTVLVANNHILAVNKPPGWHSIPNEGSAVSTESSPLSSSSSHSHPSARGTPSPPPPSLHAKCLLTHLAQDLRLGGGSDGTFLRPLHRLDQPCSGILLLGKTTKAASRIQSHWSSVEKQYLVVISTTKTENHHHHPAGSVSGRGAGGSRRYNQSTDLIAQLQQRSRRLSHGITPTSSDPHRWFELQGRFDIRPPRSGPGAGSTRRRPSSSSSSSSSSSRGWSVDMRPLPPDFDVNHGPPLPQHERICQIYWRLLASSAHHDEHYLLEVQTNQGARHMIRALLACHGAPLVGDVRYNGATPPLPDRSVALHARRLQLPASLTLNLPQRVFEAPIPLTWSQYFGWTEDQVQEWEGRSHTRY